MPFPKRFCWREYHLGQAVQPLSTNSLAFDQALKALFSYSLIQRNRSEHLISVHRLVQAVLKDAMDQAMYRLWAERTIQAVKQAYLKSIITPGSGMNAVSPMLRAVRSTH